MSRKKECDSITRSLPTFPDKLPDGGSHPDIITEKYTIDVITPLFGGGYEAGKVDPDMPIRVSSIRGHLRFWWRATRGAKYDDVKDLRQREGEIWGSMENPSPVIVEVEITSRGKTYPCAYLPDGSSTPRFEDKHPPYALFPFQGNPRKNIPIAECISGISFTLKISCPEKFFNDIEAALWAWINFGGIGARTRRGCGALYCKDLSPPDPASVDTWYQKWVQNFEIDCFSPRKWPTLSKKVLIKDGNGANAMQCWSDVIDLMKTFRQGSGVGRDPGGNPNRPKRSRWPEPETIRTVTHRRLPRHARIQTIPNNAFPRAELGLPIVFHFKDGADPTDTELYPVIDGRDKTRMASPLILRSLQCVNGDLLQMILQLNTPRVQEVVLKKAPRTPHFTSIRSSHLARYPRSPMGPANPGGTNRSDDGSALDAFIAFAQERQNNFREVKP